LHVTELTAEELRAVIPRFRRRPVVLVERYLDDGRGAHIGWDRWIRRRRVVVEEEKATIRRQVMPMIADPGLETDELEGRTFRTLSAELPNELPRARKLHEPLQVEIGER